MTDAGAPLPDLLPGLRFEPLPAGWTPLQAFVLVKCLDEDGDPAWCERGSDDINDEEFLGALSIQVALRKQNLLKEWDSDD